MREPNDLDQILAQEAKSIVALAFRNGPIEAVHAGKSCHNCNGKAEYSHINDSEMKKIMQAAVNEVYELLWLKANHPLLYEAKIRYGELFANSLG